MRYTDEGVDDMTVVAGVVVGLLILAILILRLSLWINPPRKIDKTWTSRSLTGWTNTPKKLAWSETIRKVSTKESND